MTPFEENTTQSAFDFTVPQTEAASAIPYGYCQCGCGQKTNIPTYTHRTHNIIKGVPKQYISGHNKSGTPRGEDFDERPRKNMRRCSCGGWKTRGTPQCRDCWNKEGKPPVDPETYIIGGKPRRRIPLTQDQYALVDAANYDRMMEFHYYAHRDQNGNGSYYAFRSVSIGNCKSIRVPMQYDVMTPPPGQIIDHISSKQTLNNCQDNLRPASVQLNAFNHRRNANNTSGRKNVYKLGNRWAVRIKAFGEEHYFGTYGTFGEACAVQEESVKMLHGEFASIGDE